MFNVDLQEVAASSDLSSSDDDESELESAEGRFELNSGSDNEFWWFLNNFFNFLKG